MQSLFGLPVRGWFPIPDGTNCGRASAGLLCGADQGAARDHLRRAHRGPRLWQILLHPRQHPAAIVLPCPSLILGDRDDDPLVSGSPHRLKARCIANCWRLARLQPLLRTARVPRPIRGVIGLLLKRQGEPRPPAAGAGTGLGVPSTHQLRHGLRSAATAPVAGLARRCCSCPTKIPWPIWSASICCGWLT